MNKIIENIYAHLPHDVFTDRDVAKMLPDGSHDSRYGLVKRALKSGDILRIKRGLYCLAPKFQRRTLDKFSLAQWIYGPSYISMESALSYHGWIPEGVFETVSASMQRSQRYQTPVGNFSYWRVVQVQFYDQVDQQKDGEIPFLIARPFKALCDYVYIHKQSWTSIDPLIKSLRIEKEMLDQLRREDLDSLFSNYRSSRVRAFIKGIKKDLGL